MTQFTFEQDDRTHVVTPLKYHQAVDIFYGGSGSNTTTNLERSDTSLIFFYRPEGGGPLSLVVIHDRPNNDSTGGAVSFDVSFSGSADDANWIVKDDGGDFRSGRSNPNWAWNGRNKDGGVLQGGFDGTFEVRINPAFNGDAVRNPLTPGEISNWQVLSGGEENEATSPNRKPLNMEQPVRIKDGGRGEGPGADVRTSTSTLSFIPGKDEDSLGSAGGHPLNSAVIDVFDEAYSFEFSIEQDFDLDLLGEVSVDWDVLEVDVTPAFDSWGTGDEMEIEPPVDLEDATDPKQDKYRDEFPEEAHEQYRILNTVEVAFDRDGAGSIDESSLEIEFDDEFSRTVLEAEDINTLDPEKIGARSEQTENGTSYYFAGQGLDRYADWEVIQVDGVDAVKASTIIGGHTAVAKELINELREYSSLNKYLHEVIGWEFRVGGNLVEDIVDEIPEEIRSAVESKFTGFTEMLAAVPNIFTFLEFTVLADGRRFVRLWDASKFPKHTLYLEGEQFDLTELPYSPREKFNGNFNAFLAEAAIGLVTPYYAPQLAYEAHITDGAFAEDPRYIYQDYASKIPSIDLDEIVDYEDVIPGDTPITQHGWRANDEPIEPQVIDELLPGNPLFPWD